MIDLILFLLPFSSSLWPLVSMLSMLSIGMALVLKMLLVTAKRLRKHSSNLKYVYQ